MDSDDECYYSNEDLAEDQGILLHEEVKAYMPCFSHLK